MRASFRIASLIPRGLIVESETRVGDEIRLLVRGASTAATFGASRICHARDGWSGSTSQRDGSAASSRDVPDGSSPNASTRL